MKKNRKSLVIIASTMLAFALLFGACIPYTPAPPPPPPPNLAATVTAQALQLQGLTATVLAQPIVIVITNTPDPALPPAATVDPALNVAAATPTTGGVTVTVSQNTNCRTGPSQDFKDIYALNIGQTAEVVGKNTLNNYWIIKIPDGSGNTCWLWGRYATVSGDTAPLAEAATPTPSGGEKPLAPTITTTKLSCKDVGNGDFEYQVRVNWTDNSTNETKFTIYTSPNYETYTKKADAVTVDFNEVLPKGTTMSVVVVAANKAGESLPSSTTFVCP